jgi:hypothetical protein
MLGLRLYRCFLLDARSHIASAQVIACSDDDAAKLRAREILGDKPECRGFELWELDRRVHVHFKGETRQHCDADKDEPERVPACAPLPGPASLKARISPPSARGPTWLLGPFFFFRDLEHRADRGSDPEARG